MFIQQDKTYGEVLKVALTKLRENNVAVMGKLMHETLVAAFKHYVDDLAAVRDIALRFALTFGIDTAKYRKVLLQLHLYDLIHALFHGNLSSRFLFLCRDGIMFAFGNAGFNSTPPNIRFLEVTHEFTRKLLPQVHHSCIDSVPGLIFASTGPSSHCQGAQAVP